MSKVKSRWITILSLFAALLLALGMALLLPVRGRAYAANKYDISKSNFMFRPGTTGGTVTSDMPATDDEQPHYVQFDMKDGETVEYRRDLALKWYVADSSAAHPQDGSALENPAVAKYFSMKFSIKDVNFETLTISFSGSEENISKEAKSVNDVVITKVSDDSVKVQVKSSYMEEDSEMQAGVTVARAVAGEAIEITIALNEEDCEIGEFNVTCNGTSVDKFTNIGGYYLEYRSATNTPITFKTTLPVTAAEDTVQSLLMKELNEQSFAVKLNGGNKEVEDNTPAVIVLNQDIYAFQLGQRFTLTYKVIDVCNDSVSATRQYYMLKKDENGKYVKPDEGAASQDSLYKTLTTSTYFLPTSDSGVSDPVEYISIRVKLDDGSETAYSYLSWYAVSSAVATVGDSGENNYFDYIKVNTEKSGPYYAGTDSTGVVDSTAYNRAVNAYGKDTDNPLEKAAEKASAGSGAYIYLPSLRELIKSDNADYRDLKFSIYYYKESQSATASATSRTSLSYNALKIEVDEEGWYKFRVIASDSAGNTMKYMYDGELVTVSSTNIWEIDAIPEFTFYVSYKGASIEKPSSQSLGYRNDTYTFSKFDIIALSGYTTEYNLYRINPSSEKIPVGSTIPSVSTLVDTMKDDFVKYRDTWECLDEIQKYRSDVEEGSSLWDRTDNDYHWNPDSALSFVPQESGCYVLEVIVNDAYRPGHVEKAYQVIEVRNSIDTIPGESQWLKNNVASVVLFSVSAVLAVIVVILFLVKPSDKNLEEIDLEKLKKNKKKSK